MKALLVSMTLCLGLLAFGSGHAQAPAAAPAGTTAQCKDGSWYSGEAKRGACRGHQGIKDWYGAAGAAAETGTASHKSRASKSEATAATNAPLAAAPAGATALCKDGSSYSGATKKGACRGHKGIQEWYGANAATPMTTAHTPAMPMTAPAATPAATTTRATPPMSAQPMSHTSAPAGAAGQVWVNSGTKVYHCPSDRYYGKTKQGEYMSEADALAKGNHAARGKSCAQ